MANDQFRLFRNNLPRKAYSADTVDNIVCRRIERALNYRYLQPNDFNSKVWLVYDIDRPTSPDEITDDIGLPPPHYFVQNPLNQHAHVYYGLENPVHLNANSSEDARRFAGAVDIGMTLALDADVGYAKLIAKNPINAHWRVWSCSSERYLLNDLAEYVDLSVFSDKRKYLPAIGLGRNVMVFEKLRKWAYKAIREKNFPPYEQWLRSCDARAQAYSSRTECPKQGEMDYREVKHIAESVARFTFRNFSAQTFSERQSRVGRLGGLAKGKVFQDKREMAIAMHIKGLSLRRIAQELNCSKSAVHRWVSL